MLRRSHCWLCKICMSKNALEGPDRKNGRKDKKRSSHTFPSLSNLRSHSLFTVCKQFHGSRANIHLSNPFIRVFGGPGLQLFYFPSSKGEHANFFCPLHCKSSNFWGVPVRKSQNLKFARKKQCFWSSSALACLWYFLNLNLRKNILDYVMPCNSKLSHKPKVVLKLEWDHFNLTYICISGTFLRFVICTAFVKLDGKSSYKKQCVHSAELNPVPAWNPVSHNTSTTPKVYLFMLYFWALSICYTVLRPGYCVRDVVGVPPLPSLLHGPEHCGEHGQQPGQ